MQMHDKRALAHTQSQSNVPELKKIQLSKARTDAEPIFQATAIPENVSKHFTRMVTPGFFFNGLAWILEHTFYRNVSLKKFKD